MADFRDARMWQVAAGDGARQYEDVFLDYGLMAPGPGNLGPYSEATAAQYSAFPFIRALATQMRVSDPVVSKKPTGYRWAIMGVGQVAGDYEHSDFLEDVEGWDLQHARSVQWRVPVEPVLTEGLTRGTLKEVHQATVREKTWA